MEVRACLHAVRAGVEALNEQQKLDSEAILNVADEILRDRNPEDLEKLDRQLNEAVNVELFSDTSFEIAYRWALVAERLERHEEAFRRWSRVFARWPENEWFLTRCFEVGALAGRWRELLPFASAVMPHLVRRGGALTEGWNRAVLATCLNVLQLPINSFDGDLDSVRQLIQIEMMIESSRRPQDLAFHCLALSLLDLQKQDPAAWDNACLIVDRIIVVSKLNAMPIPVLILYLTTGRRGARPDIVSVIDANIERLTLVHLEQIFGVSANFNLIPEMESILGRTLSGVILLEMHRSISHSHSPTEDLDRRLEEANGRKYDVNQFGLDLRLSEHWLDRLRARGRSGAVPFVLQNIRPLAVCIYGQMRGYRRVQENWRRFFDGFECDIYVSTWRRLGRRQLYPGPSYSRRVLPEEIASLFDSLCAKYSFHHIHSRYPSLFSLVDAGDEITEEELRDTYKSVVAVRIDEDDEPFYRSLSVQEKMFFRGKTAVELCLSAGREYASLLRIRPDLPIARGSVRDLIFQDQVPGHNDAVIWSDGVQRIEARHGFLVGDRVTLGTPTAITRFCSIWDKRGLVRPGMSGMEGSIMPHRSLGYHTLVEGFDVRRIPVEFGLMLDPPLIADKELYDAVLVDAGPRMDEVDRVFLAALEARLT
jgi:hypothetical protein